MSPSNRKTAQPINWVVAPPAMDKSELYKLISQVVPDEEHEYLREMRIVLDDWYWNVGDLVNRWYEFAVANELPATKLDVCAVISFELDDEGLGADSLYKHAEVSAFYASQEDRQKYQILPRSHLRYAASFGKEYKHILNEDIRQMDRNQGRPVSLKRLRMRFEPDYQDKMEAKNKPPEPGARPGTDTFEATAPAASYIPEIRTENELMIQILGDTARLRGNLERLQREKPRAASLISRIIRLCNDAMETLSRE